MSSWRWEPHCTICLLPDSPGDLIWRTMVAIARQNVLMDISYRLERLRADGERLIEVAASDRSAEVPGCPNWTTADLLGHMGSVWRMLTLYVDGLPTGPIREPGIPDPPAGEAVVGFARGGLSGLMTAMAGANPDSLVWTFGSDKTVAFFVRRAHLETLLHRVDAEAAVGAPTHVAELEAADAVDELLEVFYRSDGPPSGSLHLHQTNGDGEWMLEVIDGSIVVRREHSKGDAALRGTGEELMLVMWGRRSVDGLESFGDRSIIEEWVSLAP